MNNDCCSKCQDKATKKKNSKKIEEEDDEKDVKQKPKAAENEDPKTDSKEEKGSHETSDHKDKKKKGILTWQHSSTKKEKDGGKNLLSEKVGVNLSCNTAKSMMHHGGPNPSNLWPISAAPRGRYPQFPMTPPFPMAPMYGPYGGVGGLMQPYQYMPHATMFNGVHISPYPPMAAAAPFPYWQTRPYMDTNPMKRYTTYADNYSYCFI
ncbi:hypothetical protein CARUB_v10012047mg [Capsella rubella]|uniref:Uncharacterized protein n=1 Tax=Capsella rubella TaxID=81985 RepID=R0IPM9_9BRAS|nr:uncharacterized protein LOC17898690 [Capsella rubella]XP_023645351.1 uncharacterized protein LOC17898690 [Capsella rubella]XP_023645352.1 uncharacterized protein LOC17898690 [Capsella rubella]EOA39128.1 hypothetical protein CARUB_v10012047mg [Capsella rubella]